MCSPDSARVQKMSDARATTKTTAIATAPRRACSCCTRTWVRMVRPIIPASPRVRTGVPSPNT